MSETTVNTFVGGLVMDNSEATASNQVLVNALNATLQTFNGDEYTLQNDMGNVVISRNVKNGEQNIKTQVTLSNSFIPIGIAEFGGVLYIASVRKDGTDSYIGEIGSFPSPNYEEENTTQMVWDYAPLKVAVNGNNGQKVNLTTPYFNFDLEHPVEILTERCYDNSINLVITDNKNIPRLINTGFAVKDNFTCEIITRMNETPTNQYNILSQDNFDLDTSLYRTTNLLPKFEYGGHSTGGRLQVGNYVFYAVACDSDENESDIICESGVMSMFLGTDGDPFSVNGGIEDQRTDKAFKFKIVDLDSPYIKLLYSRTSAQNNQMSTTLAYKVDKLYKVENGSVDIVFTGDETIVPISIDELNIQYFNADVVKSQAICQNILFQGNLQEISQSPDEYQTLKNISANIRISTTTQVSVNLNEDYHYPSEGSKNSYYDSSFIYNYTGYFPGETYRFGIVYIRKDNSLTSVFDIGNNKGCYTIPAENGYLNKVYGVTFTAPNLSSNYKGYFFVRQKRIPTTLAQGYVTNIVEEAYVPTINVASGYILESFATGGYKTQSPYSTSEGGDNQKYPAKVSSSKKSSSILRLTNSYTRRLFTLTEQCRAYFDGISAGAFYEYWQDNIGMSKDDFSAYIPEEDSADFASIEEIDTLEGANRGLIAVWGRGNYYHNDNDLRIVFLIEVRDPNSAQALATDLAPYSKFFKEGIPTNITFNLDNELGAKQGVQSDEGMAGALAQLISDLVDENGNVKDNQRGTIYYSNSKIKLNLEENREINAVKLKRSVNASEEYYVPITYIRSKGTHHRSSRIDSLTTKFNNYASKYADLSTSSASVTGGYDLTLPSINGKYIWTTDDYVEDSTEKSKLLNPLESNAYAIYCPEFELNQPYYNNLFTGTDYTIEPLTSAAKLTQTEQKRRYTYQNTTIANSANIENNKIIGVPDSVSLMNLQNDYGVEDDHWEHESQCYFSSRCGNAGQVDFKYAGAEFLAYVGFGDSNSPTYYKLNEYRPFNLLRGCYGPYLGVVCGEDIADKIVNIKLKNAVDDEVRQNDASAYYAISDKIAVGSGSTTCHRGDCYFNYFTHRVNRNFNDDASPYNDIIVDGSSFVKGFNGCFDVDYRTFDLTKDADSSAKFNIGDINAIKLGSWVTFPVRSSTNIALRSSDDSYPNEKAQSGHDRTFFPLSPINAGGSYKMPESEVFNAGFNKSGSEKIYINEKNRIFENVYYKNRIQYSNILVHNDFINGNRVFLATRYRDYVPEFGEIVKLLTVPAAGSNQAGANSTLLCVLEHGIVSIPVNERALAGEGAGGSIFINTSNVLPENPIIISDTYGSTWQDSIIQTPYGVYGIDVNSRKIWRVINNQITIISDFKVQEFLNNYCTDIIQKANNSEQPTLETHKFTVNIGTSDIKAHYNAFKNDVMFTIYNYEDDLLWNLCYNENLQNWVTFYSWIPVQSGNIGNNFITFNSEACYSISKFGGQDSYLNPIRFYKHGHSQKVPTIDRILPTNWYGKTHPFEFEFIVAKDLYYHKIFDNLQIISNNAPPESFHYEIVGDCYDLNGEKANAYKRQEVTKRYLLNELHIPISYDEQSIIPFTEEGWANDKYIQETFQPIGIGNFGRVNKTVVFPMYYYRKDRPNIIYDDYVQYTSTNHDYDHLSGTELIRDIKENSYKLCNHVKAVDVRNNLLRGNMKYEEDIWKVQITPMNYVFINEYGERSDVPTEKRQWNQGNIPIWLGAVNGIRYNPNYKSEFEGHNVYLTRLPDKRQEMKIKDKYIKIKIRYSGTDLAIIHAINTLYTISYT